MSKPVYLSIFFVVDVSIIVSRLTITSVSCHAGITVAYAAPVRHGCLKVVENNYCASKRGTPFFSFELFWLLY